MNTVQDFIDANKIKMTVERTDSNPHMDDSRNMDHWKCVMRRPAARLTVYYSRGYGHKGAAPDPGDVLDCLASDAAGIDNARGFEDWCADYGYDSDSRRAEKIYKACERQARKLENFLGSDALHTLMYDTERL